MDFDAMKTRLQAVLSPKRFKHSIGVMETSILLAGRYGGDKDKAAIAGLLHDCARDIRGEKMFEFCNRYGIPVDNVTRKQPELLHGPLGAKLACEDYGIMDVEILDAIKCHTTGRVGMSLLDKIVFIADYIEPGRNFPGIEEARAIAAEDINRAVMFSLDRTIRYVVSKGALIHIDTVAARNDIILCCFKAQ